MDEETLAALKDSIDGKWKGIRHEGKEDKGHRDCRLCALFNDEDCQGCPIFELTGSLFCRQTPYEDWASHHSRAHVLDAPYLRLHAGCDECADIADKMIEFLESLLPTTTPANGRA